MLSDINSGSPLFAQFYDPLGLTRRGAGRRLRTVTIYYSRISLYVSSGIIVHYVGSESTAVASLSSIPFCFSLIMLSSRLRSVSPMDPLSDIALSVSSEEETQSSTTDVWDYVVACDWSSQLCINNTFIL